MTRDAPVMWLCAGFILALGLLGTAGNIGVAFDPSIRKNQVELYRQQTANLQFRQTTNGIDSADTHVLQELRTNFMHEVFKDNIQYYYRVHKMNDGNIVSEELNELTNDSLVIVGDGRTDQTCIRFDGLTGDGSICLASEYPQWVWTTESATLTWPIDDGDADEFLQTDGDGDLSWSPEVDPVWDAWLDTVTVEHHQGFTIGKVDGAGTHFVGGFHEFGSTPNDFSSPQTFMTPNVAKGAHALVVLGAETVDELTITVSGTSITDGAVRTTSDTQDIVIDSGTVADTYFETPKKWNGQISFEVTSGTPKSCNYGAVKYWDNFNRDFTVIGFEASWVGGANDSGADLVLRYHRPTGWTYNASAPPTPPTPIAGMVDDYGTEKEIFNGKQGAYKRDNLDVAIAGASDEGIMVEVVVGNATGKTFIAANFDMMFKSKLKR